MLRVLAALIFFCSACAEPTISSFRARDELRCAAGFQLSDDRLSCIPSLCLNSGGQWDGYRCLCQGNATTYSDRVGCPVANNDHGPIDPQSNNQSGNDHTGMTSNGDQPIENNTVAIEACENGTGGDIGGTWNANDSTCICPTAYQNIGGVCHTVAAANSAEAACISSPTGRWVSGACQCGGAYTLQEGACIINPIAVACSQGGTPGTWNTSVTPARCDCPNRHYLVNSSCLPCAAGNVVSADSQTCTAVATFTEAECGTTDSTWSTALQACLAGMTEDQYARQIQALCPGFFDPFLLRCLGEQLPFSEALCNVLGYVWLNDLQAASQEMVGATQGVCLPTSVNANMTAQEREDAIQEGFQGFTALLEPACTSQANQRVLAWDSDLRVCLPGRLPRQNGALVAAVTQDQCTRFGRNWIPGYGTDGLGKCFSASWSTIAGFGGSQTDCQNAGFFFSTRYNRCFPDNPENRASPRSQERPNPFTQSQCETLGLLWANNECTGSSQSQYNQITDKLSCLNRNGAFWIDYYRRCFVSEPASYAAAFGTQAGCESFALTWSSDYQMCLPASIADLANNTVYTQARCVMSGSSGDHPSANGFQCSADGFAHFEGRAATANDRIGNTNFYSCTSPLHWNAQFGICTARSTVDQNYCSRIGFTWHDILNAADNTPRGDIATCTRNTLAQISILDQAACVGADYIWGGGRIGCIPQAMPPVGSAGQSASQFDRDNRAKHIRVCNYYAGVSGAATGEGQRTPLQKGWLPNFEICLLGYVPGQLVHLAGATPPANSVCEQTGFSWHTGMNMCVPRAHTTASPTNDTTRPEFLAEDFCEEIGFVYSAQWSACYENLNYGGFNEGQCQFANRGMARWSDAMLECMPVAVQSRSCPQGQILRDNNVCTDIGELGEHECRTYEQRNDIARYGEIEWLTSNGGRCRDRSL